MTVCNANYQLPNRFAPVLTVTSGKRTYFMHVPCQYLHRGDTHIPSQDSIFLDSSSEETAKKHTNNNSSNNISNDNSKGNLAPVVVFFSGTDECAFDNEMLSHVKGSQTWLDLSDQEGVILVFAQARGYVSAFLSSFVLFFPILARTPLTPQTRSLFSFCSTLVSFLVGEKQTIPFGPVGFLKMSTR